MYEGSHFFVFCIASGTNWVGQILSELEAASGKYDEEERKKRSMKQRETELSLFPYLEFGDPGKFEVSS